MIRYSRYAHVNIPKVFLTIIWSDMDWRTSIETAYVFTHSCRFWTGYCCICSCKSAWQCIQGGFRFFRCQYLLISVYMCQYLFISVHIQQRITWATKNRVHAFWRLCLYWIAHGKGPSDWSLRSNVVVCRPNHGPWVDVKEAAARSRLAIRVTDAMLIIAAHSMLPSRLAWSKGSSQYLQRAQEAVGPGC